MKLQWYRDEWYTVFAQLPKKDDWSGAKYIEVTDKFAQKYLAARKEFEKMTDQLKKKCEG